MFILGIVAAVCIVASAAIHVLSLNWANHGLFENFGIFVMSAAEILFLVAGVEIIFKAVN